MVVEKIGEWKNVPQLVWTLSEFQVSSSSFYRTYSALQRNNQSVKYTFKFVATDYENSIWDSVRE